MALESDFEKNEDETGTAEEASSVPKQSGLSQSNKDDIGVCLVIILVRKLLIIKRNVSCETSFV